MFFQNVMCPFVLSKLPTILFKFNEFKFARNSPVILTQSVEIKWNRQNKDD